MKEEELLQKEVKSYAAYGLGKKRFVPFVL
jgi:hypothetical protein